MPRGEKRRPRPFQADQANANHPEGVDHFGAEGSRQKSGQDARVNLVVDQNSAVDDAANDRDSHGTPPVRQGDEGKTSQVK
jgi:hypothetical protein